MTFPLLTEALSVANGLFSGTERLCVRAALAAGYACSLRPGEYLDEGGRHFQPDHVFRAGLCTAWFSDTNDDTYIHDYPASQASSWPPNTYPDLITMMHDSRKHNIGHAGPSVILPNPDPAHPICFVRILTDYLRVAYLRPTQPLFSVRDTCLPVATARRPVAAVAVKHNINPSRLSMQAFRYGVNCQLPETTPEFVRRNQGGWRTTRSALHYWIRLLDHGQQVVNAVYDATAIPTPVLESLFSQDSATQQYPTFGTLNPQPVATAPNPCPPLPTTTSHSSSTQPLEHCHPPAPPSTHTWITDRPSALRRTAHRQRILTNTLPPPCRVHTTTHEDAYPSFPPLRAHSALPCLTTHMPDTPRWRRKPSTGSRRHTHGNPPSTHGGSA